MSISRLAGYREFVLASGEVVALKFCNGSTELFMQLRGITLLTELEQALTLPTHNGQRVYTANYLKSLRLYVYAAAKYVCLAENKPVNFTPWDAAEWLDEIGQEAILETIDLPEPQAATPTSHYLASEEENQTLKQYKLTVLSRLNIMPAVYYDLTSAETTALMNGVNERELFTLRQTRRLATLLRNAHFKDPQSEHEYMPLPGDNLRVKAQYTDPEQAFYMLASVFGGEIITEPNPN